MPGFPQSGFSQGMSMDPNISQPESNENKERQEQEEQMRRDFLAALLDIPARERRRFPYHRKLVTFIDQYSAVSRIALVSPERSRQIEAILLRTMRTRSENPPGRITESQLIDLLKQVRVPTYFTLLTLDFSSKVHRWKMQKGRQERKSRQSWYVCSFSKPGRVFSSFCSFIEKEWMTLILILIPNAAIHYYTCITLFAGSSTF